MTLYLPGSGNTETCKKYLSGQTKDYKIGICCFSTTSTED